MCDYIDWDAYTCRTAGLAFIQPARRVTWRWLSICASVVARSC